MPVPFMKLLVLILTLGSCFACGRSQPPADGSVSDPKMPTATRARSTELDRLDANRRLWKEKGASSYSMILELKSSSPIPPPSAVKVEVEKNSIVSVSAVSKSEESHAISLYDSFTTVDRVFGFLARELEEANKDHKLIVDYDPMFGYPKKVSYASRVTTDSGFTLRIKEMLLR